MHPSTSYLLDPLITLQPLEVREGMHVADLGSGGHGHFVFPLAALVGPRGVVYAIDILPAALSAIESRAHHDGVQHVRAIRGDLEELIDIPSHEIDRALLINTLFQTRNKFAVLEEAHRLLKPEGLLIVVEWEDGWAPLGPAPTRRLSRDHLISLAHAAGFRPRQQFSPGLHHYSVVLTSV